MLQFRSRGKLHESASPSSVITSASPASASPASASLTRV